MEQQEASNFQQVPFISRPRAGTKETCQSTGGTITYTANGLIHKGGKQYTGGATVDNDSDE